jgi:hypothetical protein
MSRGRSPYRTLSDALFACNLGGTAEFFRPKYGFGVERLFSFAQNFSKSKKHFSGGKTNA